MRTVESQPRIAWGALRERSRDQTAPDAVSAGPGCSVQMVWHVLTAGWWGMSRVLWSEQRTVRPVRQRDMRISRRIYARTARLDGTRTPDGMHAGRAQTCLASSARMASATAAWQEACPTTALYGAKSAGSARQAQMDSVTPAQKAQPRLPIAAVARRALISIIAMAASATSAGTTRSRTKTRAAVCASTGSSLDSHRSLDPQVGWSPLALQRVASTLTSVRSKTAAVQA